MSHVKVSSSAPHVHKVKVITDDEDSLGRWFKKDKPFPKEESSSVRNYMFNPSIPYLTDGASSLFPPSLGTLS